jgi:hypothetical protein
MRNLHLLLLGAAVTGCASSGKTATGGSATSASVDPAARPLVATLNAVNLTGTRITGTVKLTPTANGYRSEVFIRDGGRSNNKYPWVIRRGACGETSGDLLGTELSYKVLETSADGSARVMAPLALRVPEGALYHVEILSGVKPEERSLVVSCGVLSPT